MRSADVEIVLTQDASSGRIHKRVRVGDHLDTFEGCNLDQAGAYSVVGQAAVDAAKPDALCRYCFDVADES